MSFILNAVLWLILMYIITPYEKKRLKYTSILAVIFKHRCLLKRYNAEAKLLTTA